MFFVLNKIKYIYLSVCVIFFLLLFPQVNFAKISDKNAVKTFWDEVPIMPGAPKYFIRTEKIEKKTKSLNNHPIRLTGGILRIMLKQLSYKYDRNESEIPLFSTKELQLLTDYIPKALMNAKPNEDITFVIKGQHSSKRWALKEERLTAGRLFVSNNQLNIILGAVQVSLQPDLSERYQGNVWESTKTVYDIGHRRKETEYEGLIVVFEKNQKGIYRKSSERKDWFVFTNTAYKQAKEKKMGDKMSKEQYQTLQQQIDSLQKKLNQPQIQQQKNVPPPPPRQIQRKRDSVISEKKDNPHVVEQRLKTIEDLYKKGILSEEEYKRKRNEILKGI
tara:strand:- start:98 stop:1096 length:999 start_codon:yes stop_codon:yes gene_type:complete